MKIAQISPIVYSVPPSKYGGTERIVHDLTEELVKRGHDVTLFASGDSKTSAKLVSVRDKSLSKYRRENDIYGMHPWTMLNIGKAYQMQDQFDIIHDHNGTFGLTVANLSKIPVTITLHGPITESIIPLYKEFSNPFLITISKAQMNKIDLANHIGTVYNGQEMDHYPFISQYGNYLLFVGRISVEKGVHHAIEVANKLHLPLIIAAKVDEIDKGYFEKYVKPHLSSKIRFIGEVDKDKRNRLMSKALCFLHPVTWKEPFGLTLIEAMSCGCPVVAFRKGSIPEVIKDKQTGFVVNTIEKMIEAVRKIQTIDRSFTRNYALKNFSARAMTDGYEKMYEKAIDIFNLRKINKPSVIKHVNDKPSPGKIMCPLPLSSIGIKVLPKS